MKLSRLCAVVILGLTCFLQAAENTFDTPSDDRWHYPFNGTPGFRTTGSCFGATGIAGFNNRDGVVVVAWDTSGLITPGLGSEAYNIQSITVTLTNQVNKNIPANWLIDTTVDEWFTYDLNGDGVINQDGVPRGMGGDTDGESDDSDAGRPLELFGAGFGPTYDVLSWFENSGYIGGTDQGTVARDPFPFVYQDGTLELLHTENSPSGLFNEAFGVSEFTPTPWAIGQPLSYSPGAQSVPFDVEFQIDLTQSGGEVKRYFQEQLNQGRVFVVVTSLYETIIMAPSGSIPSFYMKEGVPLDDGAKAASLSIDVEVVPIPAVSEWGLVLMALLLLCAGTIVLPARSGQRLTAPAAADTDSKE